MGIYGSHYLKGWIPVCVGMTEKRLIDHGDRHKSRVVARSLVLGEFSQFP